LLTGIALLTDLEIKTFYGIGNLYLARLYESRGDGDRAAEKMVIARDIFERTGMQYWLKKADEEGFIPRKTP